jgi:hypothetical protein
VTGKDFDQVGCFKIKSRESCTRDLGDGTIEKDILFFVAKLRSNQELPSSHFYAREVEITKVQSVETMEEQSLFFRENESSLEGVWFPQDEQLSPQNQQQLGINTNVSQQCSCSTTTEKTMPEICDVLPLGEASVSALASNVSSELVPPQPEEATALPSVSPSLTANAKTEPTNSFSHIIRDSATSLPKGAHLGPHPNSCNRDTKTWLLGLSSHAKNAAYYLELIKNGSFAIPEANSKIILSSPMAKLVKVGAQDPRTTFTIENWALKFYRGEHDPPCDRRRGVSFWWETCAGSKFFW